MSRPIRGSSWHRCGAALAALAWLTACGDGDALGPQDPASLRTEILIEAAPEDLATAVVVDSAYWDPAVLLPTGRDDILEVEGPYRIDFRNTAGRALDLRYDLRFYDEGDLFVDNHIPFGLPVRLEAGATRREAGRFVIRSTPRVGRFGLRMMRVGVRLALADSAGMTADP